MILGCKRFEMLYPDEAIQIVERWEKEHPIITNAEIIIAITITP